MASIRLLPQEVARFAENWPGIGSHETKHKPNKRTCKNIET